MPDLVTWTFILLSPLGIVQEAGLTEMECLSRLRTGPMYVAERGDGVPIRVSCKREG